MTSRSGRLREVAADIIDSLRIGDHRANAQSTSLGIQGFAALLLGPFSSRRVLETARATTVLYAVANPVAHGARFSGATIRALDEYASTTVIADKTVASDAVRVDHSFPGLGRRALARGTTLRALLFALRCRSHATSGELAVIGGSRLWREFVFAAQAARYQLAGHLMAQIPRSTLVLTDFDRSAYARPLIRAAAARGIKTATFVHGAPNSANYAPALADTVLAWGNAQDEWWRRTSPETSREVVGRPDLVRRTDLLRECNELVVAHSAERLSPDEEQSLHALVNSATRRGIRTTLRVHPSISTSALDGAWRRVAERVDVLVSGTEAVADVTGPDTSVVVVSSSTLVDALLAGARGVVVASADRPLPCEVDYVHRHQGADLEDIAFGPPAEADQLFRSLTSSLVQHVGEDSATEIVQALARIAR